jgi:secretion/DNA translocation related CpaE-like protein
MSSGLAAAASINDRNGCTIMSTTRALLITSDDALAEEVFRLAAVVGCEPRRLSDPASVGECWRTASLVLLDGKAAAEGAALGLPRRRGVLVVSSQQAPDFWRAAFELGADQAVELPADESTLVELLAEAMDSSTTRAGRVLAVVGGCGGAGASVLATVTAVVAARRGDRCLLLDCDPLGGGLDLAVGEEASEGLRWSGLTVSGGRVAASALHEALPSRRIGSGALTVLSCDRDGDSSGLTEQAVRAVIAAGRRAGETVVCDVPRSLPEAAAAALRLADLTLVVIPAEVRACAAASRLVAGLRDCSTGPIRAVVRGPAASGLKIADVESAVGLDVLTAMRPHPGLPAAMDRSGLGTGRFASRGPVARASRDVLTELASAQVHEGSPVREAS